MARLIDLDLNPDDRTLRQFGVIALFGFGGLGLCAYHEVWMFAFGLGAARLPTAFVLAGLGLLSLVLGLLHPRANRVIFVGTALLAYPIGFVLSYVIMAVLFFGIIAPIGTLLRLLGKNPLARSYDRSAPSYWSRARPPRPPGSYFRQF